MFDDAKDLRLHLYLFHRKQPDIYLKKFGYKSKVISKTIKWVRLSFKAYCKHRQIMMEFYKDLEGHINLRRHFRLANQKMEQKYNRIIKEEGDDYMGKEELDLM